MEKGGVTFCIRLRNSATDKSDKREFFLLMWVAKN